MKKFNIIKIILLSILLFPISCIDIDNSKFGTSSNDSIVVDSIDHSAVIDTLGQEILYGAPQFGMYNEYEKEFTLEQFDSICKADLIIKDLSKWHQLKVYDGETEQIVIEYLFIKSVGKYECIYRLVKVSNTIYKITKRVRRS